MNIFKGSAMLVALLGASIASSQVTGLNLVHRTLRDGRTGFWSAKATFIEYRRPTTVQSLAGRSNETDVRQRFNNEVRRLRNQTFRGSPANFELHTTVSITDSNLVSLYYLAETVQGASRGTQILETSNFGLVSGRARKLTLDDVLFSNNLRDTMNRILRNHIVGTDFQSFTNRQLESWVVTPTGLSWIFARGSLGGSNDFGMTVAKVPWSEINHLIRRNGPLGVFRDSASATVDNSLFGSWELTRFESMDDSITNFVNPGQFTLTLNRDGTLSGRADVNNFRGTFSTRANELITLNVLATNMALPPPGSFHDRYMTSLKHVRTFTIRNGVLSLALEFDSGILHFRRAR